MKKLTISLLSIMTWFFLLNHILSAQTVVEQNITENTEDSETTESITIAGAAMSEDDFRSNFSGDPELRQSTYANRATYADEEDETLPDSQITIYDIVINGENISFNANITMNGTATEFGMNGLIRAGFKEESGINSTIIYIPDRVNGFEVLLFEIFNDTEEDNLLITPMIGDISITSVPHIKIYLRDENNYIHLFESEMPECFSDFDASQYPEAPKEKDGLWASELVNHVTDEVETSAELLDELEMPNETRGLNTWTKWTNPTIYKDEFYVGADKTTCYSLPYILYRHTNVTSADSTWGASFKVAEHTKIGKYTYHGNNVFEYRNLSIAFACGDRTTFLRTFQEGRMTDYKAIIMGKKKAASEITIAKLQNIVSTVPYGTTFTKAIGFINSQTSESAKVKLGSSGINLNSKLATAVGEKLSKYTFEKCSDYSGKTEVGDYFTLQAVLQYEASTKGTSSTVGALVVSFDKYYTVNDSFKNIKKQFQLSYSSKK